jgi:hypothetical protein
MLFVGAAFIVILSCWEIISAQPVTSSVSLQKDFNNRHRDELIEKLRVITGWSELQFDDYGRLRPGQAAAGVGSNLARKLLIRAISGDDQIVLEDASGSNDVVFCQVVRRLSDPESQATSPFIRFVRIDFDDFDQLMGDSIARQAFDVAWGVLHELDHVVNRSQDAEGLGEPGKCETNINLMRRELNLPERVEYFYTLFPSVGDDFKSRFVRLAFDRQIVAGKKKRYWILWDAALVGGGFQHREIASTR